MNSIVAVARLRDVQQHLDEIDVPNCPVTLSAQQRLREVLDWLDYDLLDHVPTAYWVDAREIALRVPDPPQVIAARLRTLRSQGRVEARLAPVDHGRLLVYRRTTARRVTARSLAA